MKILVLVLVAFGTLTSAAKAQLSDSNMIKIVFRDTSPGIAESSFGAKPKTLYRIGHTYGRLEEMLDSNLGIHALMIVAEPKMWMIDRADSSGRLIIDPGPTFNFYSPIAKVDSKPGLSPLKDFEFGTEYDYLHANKQYTLLTPPPCRAEL